MAIGVAVQVPFAGLPFWSPLFSGRMYQGSHLPVVSPLPWAGQTVPFLTSFRQSFWARYRGSQHWQSSRSSPQSAHESQISQYPVTSTTEPNAPQRSQSCSCPPARYPVVLYLSYLSYLLLPYVLA